MNICLYLLTSTLGEHNLHIGRAYVLYPLQYKYYTQHNITILIQTEKIYGFVLIISFMRLFFFHSLICIGYILTYTTIYLITLMHIITFKTRKPKGYQCIRCHSHHFIGQALWCHCSDIPPQFKYTLYQMYTQLEYVEQFLPCKSHIIHIFE